ncbi:MotB family protein [Aquabacter sp. CN5-332]|uniref:MotB family protein n=1 Tax=Aquabacter sp. CN5-332 TaxID=3156608 RepID=UPI0032B4ECCC
MSDNGKHDIIIVRRYEEEEHEAHSSAWKVAHADFMTAMMAFFLIMWLINVTDQDVRKVIAQYFNPINLSDDIIPRRGLNNPQDAQDEGTSDDGAQFSAVKNTKGAASGQGDDMQQGARERALFQDPYASLAELAATAQQPVTGVRDVAVGDVGKPGTGTGDAQRDPFDPAYWQTASTLVQDGDRQSTQPYIMQQSSTGQISASGPVNTSAGGEANVPPSPEARADTAKGGKGERTDKTEKAGDQAAQKLEDEINAAVKSTMGSVNAPLVEVRVTREGLVLNLMDDANFSMFAVGSAQPDPKLVRAMEKVAKILASRPGEVVIRGYTDGRPFRSEMYDNWRLSTARAHVAHYMLARGGLDEKRVTKIEGFADRRLKNPGDPNAPENRRIEILLREPAT